MMTIVHGVESTRSSGSENDGNGEDKEKNRKILSTILLLGLTWELFKVMTFIPLSSAIALVTSC